LPLMAAAVMFASLAGAVWTSQRAARRAERNMEAQRSLAMNLTTLADTRVWGGDFKPAIENLEQGLRAGEELARLDPNDLGARKIMGLLEHRVCTILASAGNPAGAVSRCKASIDHLEPLLGSKVNDKLLRGSLAAAYGTYSKLKTTAKDPAQGVV